MKRKWNPLGRFWFKAEQEIGAIVLYVLFGGISVLKEEDDGVRKEIDGWKEGMTYYLECCPGGPALMFRKEKNHLYRMNPNKELADTCIMFRHMGAAFRVLIGMQGIAGSYAAHGFALKGDISTAMTFSRVVDITESYLFPIGMTRRILKEVSQKEISSIEVYARIILGAIMGKYRIYPNTNWKENMTHGIKSKKRTA